MSDTELTISRRIAAPRAAVWAAWADLRRLEEWFCPRPWRAEVTALELRTGGAFGTVMHGPDTLYTGRVLHATAEDRRKHEEMGLEPGWSAAIAQQAEVARRQPAEPA